MAARRAETGRLFSHMDRQSIRSELLKDETEAAYQRILQLELQPIPGNFDFDHLKEIHQFILHDVYDWAGPPHPRHPRRRHELPHRRPEHIENQGAFIFRGIAKDNFPQGLPKGRAFDRLAYHWGETTVLHPFRGEHSPRTRGLEIDKIEGGNHTKVVVGGRRTVVARHSEIPELRDCL